MRLPLTEYSEAPFDPSGSLTDGTKQLQQALCHCKGFFMQGAVIWLPEPKSSITRLPGYHPW